MDLKDQDYQSLKDLMGSHGWKLLCSELDDRIKAIEKVILDPNPTDMLGTDDPQKHFIMLAYKKAERAYLLQLRELPEKLIGTRIKK